MKRIANSTGVWPKPSCDIYLWPKCWSSIIGSSKTRVVSQRLRDLGALLSAIAQPRSSFGGKDLCESIEEKAAALCYSLVLNHPFVDGDKRLGHAAMEVLLALNGYELDADANEAEQSMLGLAGGQVSRVHLLDWVRKYTKPKGKS